MDIKRPLPKLLTLRGCRKLKKWNVIALYTGPTLSWGATRYTFPGYGITEDVLACSDVSPSKDGTSPPHHELCCLCVQLVINEVSGHSAQALQAVKLLAQYMGNKTPKVQPHAALMCSHGMSHSALTT